MSKNRPRIAITGANGFLGSQLVDYFKGKGWEVVALVRNAANYSSSPLVQHMGYDLSKPLDPKILEGTDYLIHAAYVKHNGNHSNTVDVNVDGASLLLAASHKAKIKKNLFISSMSAHNQAISSYGVQKLTIEKLFNGTNDVVLRPGLIVGDGGIVKNMTSFMKKWHLVPLVGGGHQPIQIIAVKDLVLAIDKAFTNNVSGTFVIATPEVYSYKEFYQAIAEYLKIKVIFLPLPYIIISFCLKLAKLCHLPLNINEDNLLGLKMLKAVDNKKDLEALGIKVANLDKALDQSQLS